MNNFNLKKFLTENRLTSNTRPINEEGGFDAFMNAVGDIFYEEEPEYDVLAALVEKAHMNGELEYTPWEPGSIGAQVRKIAQENGLMDDVYEQDQSEEEIVEITQEDTELLNSRNALPVIDLGDSNGWDGRMKNLYNALVALETTDPKDKAIVSNLNFQGTYRQVSQVVGIPRRRYNIIYAVDSSD